MDRNRRPSSWDELPDEILLQIIAHLEPCHITRLQLVSHKLQKLCLDDELWKQNCFDDSPCNPRILRKMLHPHPKPPIEPYRSPHRRPTTANTADGESRTWLTGIRRSPRSEYLVEARGVALYNPYDGRDGNGTMLAVSPLDDGSVCLWDIQGTRGKQGSIVGRSKPDILFIDGPGGQNQRRSKRIDTGVTECVSVNHQNNKAFFAVQSHLIEVDLNRLEVVSRESFEWSITTMSAVNDGLPLTVGTSLGIHLHDFRARSNMSSDRSERVDWNESDVYKSIFDPKPLPPYASLSQPTPISILHLPRAGSHSQISDDIYVSGRFTNILHYDRRKFPAIVGSIYSGGLIKSLAAVPYPYSSVDYEIRRQGELPMEKISRVKSTGSGVTLIAGGSYKLKGSLEMYGLSSTAHSSDRTTLQNAVMKNRQTAASSTILSLTTHGTRIVFSDGTGLIKWFERDGFTECRRHKIGSYDQRENILFLGGGRGEIARKIVSTKLSTDQDRPNNDNILFWTGERLGMLNFGRAPLCHSDDFEQRGEEMAAEEEKRQQYTGKMREALERQTDEIRLMSRFGHGPA
ncbi:hypothetical protein LMH87_006053 [Akanthomyces muscarius]|uniref:F-box domain-containing protein n=1 Tax=Akanthomyces muscarius TaxID=2231603 RepID=A0A9W8UPX3_AKAMU|nr:hypothetical protein LMH87_006053 [Akanthomyces muscarius]KAJ4164377.1 hypothetical protein LMH87_006053 [Akanthomyces muscarius]